MGWSDAYESDEDYKNLKDAMADGTIPRPAVDGLFAKFCK